MLTQCFFTQKVAFPGKYIYAYVMMEKALEIADVEEKNMKIADVGIENCDKRGRVEDL